MCNSCRVFSVISVASTGRAQRFEVLLHCWVARIDARQVRTILKNSVKGRNHMLNRMKVSWLIVRTTLSFLAVVFSSALTGTAQMHGVSSSAPSMRTAPSSNASGVSAPVTALEARGRNLPSCRRGSEGPRTFGYPGIHEHNRSGHRIISIVHSYYPFIQ